MLVVTISEKGAPATGTNFDKTEVTIGRVKGNDIVLPKTNVSKRHARIVVKDGKIILIDLKSTNGTYINGRKITNPQVITDADKIFIGDFTLEVKEAASEEARPAAPHIPMPSFGMSGPSVVSLPSVPHGEAPSLEPKGPGADLDQGHGIGHQDSRVPAPNMGPGYSAGGPSGAKPGVPAGPGAMGAPPAGPMGPPSLGPTPGAAHAGPGAAHAGPGAGGLPNLSQAAIPSAAAPNLGQGVGPAAIPAPSGPAAINPSRPVGAGLPHGDAPAEGHARPAAASPEKAKPSVAASAALSRGAADRAIYPASLPEEVYVEDTRTEVGDAKWEAARMIMDHYIAEVGLDNLMAQAYPPEPEAQDASYAALSNILQANFAQVPANVNHEELLDICLKESAFLGCVEYLLDDEQVSDFTVYRPEMIVADRAGKREITDYQFTSPSTLYLAAQRLLQLQGINVQTAPSFNEVRLGDGTQIQVMLPPAAVNSASITVRKLRRSFYSLNELVKAGTLSGEMEKFLLMCIKARRNILIVGPHGSGRTTLLNALASEVVDGERIASVESSAMLMLPQISAMALEVQPASNYGQGSDMASLIRQAVRMRAERLFVDTLSTGADASAFVHALCGGVQGSMACATGLRVIDGVDNLARLLTYEGHAHSEGAAQRVLSAIDVVISMRAYGGGKRRIVEIAELSSDAQNNVGVVSLFQYKDSGMGERSGGSGKFQGMGTVARFYKELEKGGVSLDSTVFNS